MVLGLVTLTLLGELDGEPATLDARVLRQLLGKFHRERTSQVWSARLVKLFLDSFLINHQTVS